MRRREFIAGLGSAAAWPLMVYAQEPSRLPTIAFLRDRPGSTTGAGSVMKSKLLGVAALCLCATGLWLILFPAWSDPQIAGAIIASVVIVVAAMILR
jgi:hypothetical protein